MLVIGPGSIRQVGEDGKIEDLTPGPSPEAIDVIVQTDRQLWNGIGNAVGLKLIEIEAHYRGKNPVTPWHQASMDGGVLVMGTRWSVYSVKVTANEVLPGEKWDEILNSLPDRSAINPQWMDGDWVGGSETLPAGRAFEIHVDRGAEERLTNLLSSIREALDNPKSA